MRSSSPLDLTYESVFSTCISTETEAKQKNYSQCLPSLLLSIESYDRHMSAKTGHLLKAHDVTDFEPLSKKELKWLYKSRLLGKDSPARKYYDKILVSSMKKSCFFCSYEEPIQLDHFLPISRYSQYAIYPKNLVPICHRCNREKFTHAPQNPTDNFIHPYFESYDDLIWLNANIQYEGNTPIAIFNIGNNEMEDDVISRIRFQFKQLKLCGRYTFKSGRELAGRYRLFLEAFQDRDALGLEDDLKGEARSMLFPLKNWTS